jgi:transketolase
MLLNFYHSLFSASSSTFCVFSDYFRPSIRLAALSNLNRVSYILTHDSIAIGQDGPTHQPIETISSLRLIPNLHVYRPADAEETVSAYIASVTRKHGPVALVLSRQKVDQNFEVSALHRRKGTLKGAYIAKKEDCSQYLDCIIIATGSELSLALQVSKEFPGVRVVSMPCIEQYQLQSKEYQETILPSSCQRRIAIEAGVCGLWYRYAQTVIGVDTFGLSAPGEIVLKHKGVTKEALRKAICDRRCQKCTCYSNNAKLNDKN